MKLVNYARTMGISYKTAWRGYKAEKIAGLQMDTGTILVTGTVPMPGPVASPNVAIYARVSSAEHTANLDSLAQRLVAYCTMGAITSLRWSKRLDQASMRTGPSFWPCWLIH